MSVERGRRKVKRGIVLSDKMDKTVVVSVETTILHPRYQKVIARKHKCYVHCDGQKPAIGSEVVIMETRPLSKLKRWRLVG